MTTFLDVFLIIFVGAFTTGDCFILKNLPEKLHIDF